MSLWNSCYNGQYPAYIHHNNGRQTCCTVTILHNQSDVEMRSSYFHDIYSLRYGLFVTVCDVLVAESVRDEIFVSW